MRIHVAVLMSLALLSSPTFAQTVAERLQKAIYEQETAGNLDEAIQIYRQIIASSPSQRVYAAQAQLRLAQTLLEKGDLAGAASEYQILATRYGAEPELISTLTRRTRARNANSGVALGLIADGRYRHNLTGIEFVVPQGWTVSGDADSSGGGQMVMLADSVSKANAFVWMRPYDGHGDLAGELRFDVEEKPKMRGANWKYRPASVQMRTIAGEQAISAVADDSGAVVEYLIWIRSTRSRLLYSVRVAAADFPAFQSRFDQLIGTVRIP